MKDQTPTQSVAIIGASADRSKFGNRSLRAHRSRGYEVFPVNPRGGLIEGLVAYRSIDDVPRSPLDRVSMYVPPEVGITLLPAIAAKGCTELWLNPGSESDRLVEQAHALGLNPIVACSLLDCEKSTDQAR